MTKKISVPSRKGRMKKILTIIILTALVLFSNPVNCNSSMLREGQRIETTVIDKYVKRLESRGYENVDYQPSFLVKFSKENNIPLRPSISNSINIEESFIRLYDYYTTYYSIQVNEKEYLFKNNDEATNFINNLNKYDGQEYTIETTTKMIERETEENEINDIIEIKRQEYEEAKAKAEAEAKAKEEAERKAREQEHIKSTTTYSSSPNDLSALQSYAYDLVINSYGWSEEDFNALINLWNKESGWNPNSHNGSSGAHGIPQALPASKMSSEGSDYYTNGETQIRWGLKYISQRYGSPLNAWNHSVSKGWY